MKDCVHAPHSRGASVKADWRAGLPQEKNEVFEAYVQEFETSYSIFSISLNEAIEFWQAGGFAKSYQVVCITSSLCGRLAQSLAATLRALGEHAKHYGTIPNSAPLDAANFQSIRNQRAARMSGLLSRVLLSQRSQFLHKTSTLQELVEDLGSEFRNTADEIASGLSTDPPSGWEALDVAHYDLNTCLRESVVLLKSFLVAVPDDQLADFQTSVRVQMRLLSLSPAHYQTAIRHRRMPAIAGQ